ncbi:hypothetical protein [uncultured Desulfosarcina sp.]|uniref:hypothetical protein n=1 Tax=uncultured Desulfosarcina sp. TaxID=218289 RepID=UPI0029C631BC|nr:hypothetical protein [uncultured Desulfosarcina sp.]
MKKQRFAGEEYLRSMINAFLSPVLIIDKDLIIHDANIASERILGSDWSLKQKRLCGYAINCIYTLNTAGTCGKADACFKCAIRQTSEAFINGTHVFKQIADMSLKYNGKIHEICFIVSCAPFRYQNNNYFILTLEDITELSELHRIVPICSFCHKVRDDSDCWQQVDEYFHKYSTVKFSHGICSDCAKKNYPGLILNE